MRKLLIVGPALAGGLVLAGLPVGAQDGGTGPRLTFGFDQTFDTNDNLDLDPLSAGQSTQSFTGLSFGLYSETGLSTLAFDASTALRILDAPYDQDPQFDLDDTNIGLAYSRSNGSSTLSVDGYFTSGQIDNLLTLGDFGPGVVVPEDLSLLNGTGTRQSYGLSLGLALAEDEPVGYEFGAGINGLGYADTSDPDLYNNQRSFVDAAMVLQVSPVTAARIGLNYGDFNTDDPDIADADNYGLDVDLTREFPNGTAGLNLFAEDYSDSGPRAGFSLSRDLELPAGALAISLGATRLEEADTELTGDLSWLQQTPRGLINVGLSRDVQNDSDNVPQLTTALFMGYDHEISPLSQIGFDLSYYWGETVGSQDWSENATVAAVYTREMTEDWALDLGYLYQQRQDNGEDKANSNSVFLSLRRSWELRP